MRLVTAIVTTTLAIFAADQKTPPAASKGGIKTPGIQIPIDLLKPEAQFAVESPGWITTGESVFVSNKAHDTVFRVDPKTNKPLDAIAGLSQPCSGGAVAFGALWVPECGTQSLARYDTKANKITALIASGVTDILQSVAVTVDSVWIITDSKTTLSRIDPSDNRVVGELRLPANCSSVAYGENSLWVTCPSETRLLRISPITNLVEKRIEVSAGPRAVAFGGGSVWVLCGKDGKIDRIDPKANKVIKSIDLLTPDAGGNLAFADGFLWVTQSGFPLTRVDPAPDKEAVAQQFWGLGGGLINAAPGALWLSNVGKGTVWRLDPKRVIATLAE